MRVWEVWSEGYRDNGGGNGAIKHGLSATPTFDEAVLEVFQATENGTVNGNRAYDTPNGYKLYKNNQGIWTYWGCRIFDNEIDARRSFG